MLPNARKIWRTDDQQMILLVIRNTERKLFEKQRTAITGAVGRSDAETAKLY